MLFSVCVQGTDGVSFCNPSIGKANPEVYGFFFGFCGIIEIRLRLVNGVHGLDDILSEKFSL
jgi:hypothetical protein